MRKYQNKLKILQKDTHEESLNQLRKLEITQKIEHKKNTIDHELKKQANKQIDI